MSVASSSKVRVRYAETDQMGVAYHGGYFAWFEVGRTDLLRTRGFTYRELEAQDLRLPVIEARARFLKGLIYTEQGNTREAIEMFRKLTEDYPELPEPYNNLAVIYASQGQYDRARAALEQSIRTHPSYATAYENLGDVYAKLASQAYDKALKLDSSNAGAQNKLALVRELVGNAAPVRIATAEQKPAAARPAAWT